MNFELALDGIDKEFVLTPEKVERWKQAIGQILVSSHKEAEKQKVVSYPETKIPERLNFACPFCGDSMKNPRKKRGNFWIARMQYVCYNGDCDKKMPFDQFLSHFGLQDVLDGDDISHISHIKSSVIHRPKMQWEDIWGIGEIILSRDTVMQKLRLKEVYGTPMEDYLKKRLQFENGNFAVEEKSGNLVVFNTDWSHDKIIGLQVRNMTPGASNKYYTYKLSKVYDLCGIPRHPDIERVDRISHLFGVMKLNFSSPITIFEGPLDSFLLNNSMGICSVKNDVKLDIPVRWLLDGDADGKKKSMSLLSRGETIFLWEKARIELGLPNKPKWDYNDLLLYCREHQIEFNPEAYFSRDRMDALFI